MSFLDWLKTSEKAVDTGLDLVKDAASGIDMLFFTDEEKAQASLKIMDNLIAFQQAQKDENSIRARTRRALAKMIIGMWLLIIGLGVGCAMAGDTDLAEYMFKTANETMGTAAVSVIVFYFGYYGVMSVMKWVKK